MADNKIKGDPPIWRQILDTLWQGENNDWKSSLRFGLFGLVLGLILFGAAGFYFFGFQGLIIGSLAGLIVGGLCFFIFYHATSFFKRTKKRANIPAKNVGRTRKKLLVFYVETITLGNL